MGDWSCVGCGQPMLPEGVVKRPNEYDHAHGCPFDAVRPDVFEAVRLGKITPREGADILVSGKRLAPSTRDEALAPPTPDEAERIVVCDVSQDGTGPWKVYVAGYGVASFPSKACVEQPREYAEEVARVIRMGVSALLSDRPCPINHSPQTDEIEQEIRAIYDGWGESDDSVDDLVKRLAYLVLAAEARGIEKGLTQRCPEVRRQCIERAEARGRTKMREAAAMECKATGFVWSGTTVAEILYRRILALP